MALEKLYICLSNVAQIIIKLYVISLYKFLKFLFNRAHCNKVL